MHEPRPPQKIASEPKRATPPRRIRVSRDPEYEVALGYRIRAARLNAKVNQTALGAALGVSYQQIQKYEAGRDRVAVSTLHSIATALGVKPGSFFDESMPVPVGSVPDVKAAFKAADVLGQIRDPRVLNRLLALAKVLADSSNPETQVDDDPATDPDEVDPVEGDQGRR